MTVLQFHTFVATVVSRIEVLPCRWPSLPAGRTDAEKIRIVEESLQGYRHALLDEASSWVKVSRLCTNRYPALGRASARPGDAGQFKVGWHPYEPSTNRCANGLG